MNFVLLFWFLVLQEDKPVCKLGRYLIEFGAGFKFIEGWAVTTRLVR